MGGLALETYRRAFESNRKSSSANKSQNSTTHGNTRTKPLPPPINTDLPLARPPSVPIKEVKHASSFVAPTDLHHTTGATGKRPAGTRLTTEPAMLAVSQSVMEIQKGKKGLPFLKNPMSGLLMRRKASQNVPDLRPLPLPQKPGETTYDPRIRGTRVHDFSAPRQRVVPTRKPTVPGAEVWTGWDKYHSSSPQSTHGSDLPLRTQTGKSSSAASEATQAAVSDGDLQNPAELSKEPSKKSASEAKRISLEDKPLPSGPPPTTAGATKEGAESNRSVSTTSRPTSTASMQRTSLSTRTNKSHHVSLSEDAISLSALPRHMKSTSSRFSFDMIGAARAEKLLEERHRQKEMERKANGEPANRDSRFDDFDEDAFDYDAAMDDDGLEEAIPGVNADYEDDYFEEEDPFEEEVPMVGDDVTVEEEDHPDNDQENFAGFVFSRSNPQSSLVSPATPAMVMTPRDACGRPIGHAFTKDRTPEIPPAASPIPTEEEEEEEETPGNQNVSTDVQLAGLGIQGSEGPPKTQYDPTVFQERRNERIDDEPSIQDKGIYYDAGLLEELQMEADEIQKTEFDESIFDDDDVDDFGRPKPGVFAHNLAMRVQEREQKKRDSEVTSHSGVSASTAHTSVSAGLQPVSSTEGDAEATNSDSPPTTSDTDGPEEKVVAYQKALVEAAHKAAASGWKSRWDDDTPEPNKSSPSGDPDVTITSPTTGSQPSSAGFEANSFNPDDYEDDGFGHGFDDGFDDDSFDEAFIAEANAEALAYDSDGFYGDEFGFYSSPLPARPGGHGSSASSSAPPGNDSLYGGYFGPSGNIGRSVSGRVLREPNLTPITERSEYSNRNSVMSMGPLSGTFPGDFRGSIASPGFDHALRGIDDSHLPVTLGDLTRLRGKTFGGSQISLGSSRDGSPRSERAPLYERFEGSSSPAPWELGRSQTHLGGVGGQAHERKNSAFSIWSNSDIASATGSPTMTMAGMPLSNANIPPQPLFSPPPPPIPHPSPGSQCPPVLEDEAEESSSPGRTAKTTPAESESSPSPDGTLRGTPTSSESMIASPAGTFGEGYASAESGDVDGDLSDADVPVHTSSAFIPAPLNSPPPVPSQPTEARVSSYSTGPSGLGIMPKGLPNTLEDARRINMNAFRANSGVEQSSTTVNTISL